MSIEYKEMSSCPLDEQKCPMDIQMSICPLDKQKGPFDIQMSIRTLDQHKCSLDIQMFIRPLDQHKCPLDIKCPFVHWTNGHSLIPHTLVSYRHGIMPNHVTSLQLPWHCKSYMSIGPTESSIGHSNVHSSI